MRSLRLTLSFALIGSAKFTVAFSRAKNFNVDCNRSQTSHHLGCETIAERIALDGGSRVTTASRLEKTSEPDSKCVDKIRHNRRDFLNASLLLPATFMAAYPTPALAAFTAPSKPSIPLKESLYLILRAKEATQQEARLINSGKFKDVQRANVKLAVKFIVENYRLSDNFIAASAYLEGNKRIQAGEIGQGAVQSLYTILEYFDSSDVQNIRVDNMSGKEQIVLKGLEATRIRIDDFISFFPQAEVDAIKDQIKTENDLNTKEFDPELGVIVNPDVKN
mmetsp:Transcript_6471/g.9423  ORF Transcript_6471/g.9423 Transcript_6471/m.9423 type:complete len:278 (+) Transcript_6471:52-885(+)|eukprot:CAMPEP_0195508406 /NCGR_PEP_ID=MMETSP0794_2-20130614/1618_1 /TAXON_ID=515487 /ORGANISM="Stephanopyxis turris, Strain CCMP 815" /LENGTH=277 /DNA_ID=CAMNT_0040635353 /DNA_START=49 /DNA_END=882 /DNA_ORIENTATION=+